MDALTATRRENADGQELMRRDGEGSLWTAQRVRALLTVMGLPLVDGVFASLLLAGGLDTIGEAVTVGLFVFGGSAAISVVIGQFTGPTAVELRRVAVVGAVLAVGVIVEAVFAPTIASVVDTRIFRYVAAVVIAVIAARIYGGRAGEIAPHPTFVLGVGLVASVRPTELEIGIVADPTVVLHGLLAVGVAVAAVAVAVVFRDGIRTWVNMYRFRVGSAAALAVLALHVIGVVPSAASWMVLGGAVVAAVK